MIVIYIPVFLHGEYLLYHVMKKAKKKEGRNAEL